MTQIRPGGFNILPEVVKNLLIINGICFLAYIILLSISNNSIDLNRLLGLYYVGSERFHTYQFVTHLFMHDNLMHIFANMFALWMFGSVLENVWGPKRFLIYYFLTGLGAAVLHSMVMGYNLKSLENATQQYVKQPTYQHFHKFANEHMSSNPSREVAHEVRNLLVEWSNNPGNEYFSKRSEELVQQYYYQKTLIPTVGASGAVFGVLLAFGMLFPNTYIYLMFLFPIRAKYFVIFYGLFELYAGLQNQGGNIAHFAHIGGMLFGFLLIKYWQRNRHSFY